MREIYFRFIVQVTVKYKRSNFRNRRSKIVRIRFKANLGYR